jgi:Uma2 family endonuclease
MVIHDPTPEEIEARIDWSAWYLTDEEDMGEGREQGLIIRLLVSILEHLARVRGWQDCCIGADNFFAWVPEEPLVRVSPDVFLLFDPPDPVPDSWQTWLPGHKPPRFALEVVSQDEWRKDYEQAPAKYAQLGAEELIIFDPRAAVRRELRSARRVPLQLYARQADGTFLRLYAGDGPTRSSVLDAFLVVRVEGDSARLRLSWDAAGEDLVPTGEEAAQKALEAAEREVKRLREELARRQADGA